MSKYIKMSTNRKFWDVGELPFFPANKEQQRNLFTAALEKHPGSCPADAWVVVNAKGICEEGFLSSYAFFSDEFLGTNPQFRLCWAADMFGDQ